MTKSSRPRSFETETQTKPETFETETPKNGSRDASRDRDQVSRLHHCEVVFINCSLLLVSRQALMHPHQCSTHNLALGDMAARPAFVHCVGSRGRN